MLLNRKYINDIARELEKAQGINEHLHKMIDFLKNRNSKLKLDKLRNYCRQLTGIDILGTGEDE